MSSAAWLADVLGRAAAGELTLLDAFRVFGPPSGVPAHDALVERAGELLAAEMDRLVRKKSARPRFDVHEDAAQDALLELQATGPRGIRHRDPETDAQVGAFLAGCLKHGYLDFVRSARPEVDASDEHVPGHDPRRHEPWTSEEVGAAVQLLADCRRRLLEEIGPEIAAGRSGAHSASFLQTLREMADVEAGTRSLGDLFEAELRARPPAGPLTPELRRTIMNRITGRRSKALKALHERIRDMRAQRLVTAVEHLGLLLALDDFRLRLEGA